MYAQLEAAFQGTTVIFEFVPPKSGRAFRGTYIPAFDAANEPTCNLGRNDHSRPPIGRPTPA